jgi:glucose-1-phosphatase
VIVWDLAGVVARFDPDARLTALAATTGLPSHAIDAAIWGSGLDAAADLGALDSHDAWAAVLAALEHRTDPDGVRRCWALAFVPNAAVLALVDEIAGPHALLTDNGPILEACLEHELRTIADRFDPVLLSWRLGVTKADPTAYDQVAAALALPPSELTLVDDTAGNVDRARAAGWHAVLFESVDALPEALARVGGSG